MVVKRLLAILFVIVLAGVVVLSYRSGPSSQKSYQNPLSKLPPESQETVVDSPDGTIKLVMTKKKNQNGALIYSFSTKEESGKSLKIFEKTATFGEEMSLPQNSFSPDNKYLFIKDTNGYKTDYLVFRVNGEPFSTGEEFINATELFDQKVKGYNLKSLTGWDDPVLMNILTVNGPRFWFDITTRSFIQLVS